MTFEYKVIPSPTRGLKAKGVKGPDGRFAHALEHQMNMLAAEGWEFVRAETLPNEERSGLTGSATTYRSVLVFRRNKTDDVAAFHPERIPATSLAVPATPPVVTPEADMPVSEQEADAPAANEEYEETSEEASATEVSASPPSDRP
ncbi:DUF4177 domain-containing protein [Shimia sp. R11_0]|uniref:DUF4177 domain-containing protein n=1 Tax=Shimia sp. R11_0 TaxID=2821096 RepID=UPI001FFE0F60|nr:DUF4177 domain-containing protein [Shimia sp. R11_0]